MYYITEKTLHARGGVKLFPGGAIAVEFFLIISGYLMAVSAAKRMKKRQPYSVGTETADFLWHKVKGLLPDVYVAWIAAIAVFHFARHLSVSETVRKVLFSIFDWLFLTQSGMSGYRFNGVTWYLSAMLLAMALLYPLLIWKRDLFLSWLAPLIAVFFYGYMYQAWGNLSGPTSWVGFAMKGFIRAVAAISLGCFCYTLNQKWDRMKPTKLCRVLLTVAECGCYLFAVVMAFLSGHSKWDFIIVFFFAIGITLSFSQKSGSAQVFWHPCFNWLGIFSLDLYLSHAAWCYVMNELFPAKTYWQILPYYVMLSFFSAFVVMIISKWIGKRWGTFLAFLQKLMWQHSET